MGSQLAAANGIPARDNCTEGVSLAYTGEASATVDVVGAPLTPIRTGNGIAVETVQHNIVQDKFGNVRNLILGALARRLGTTPSAEGIKARRALRRGNASLLVKRANRKGP